MALVRHILKLSQEGAAVVSNCVCVCSADDMGLGKTLTMIALLLIQRAAGEDSAAGSTSASWLSAGHKGTCIAASFISSLNNPRGGWLGSRVVSMLDSGAEGPGLKSLPRRCRVTWVMTHFLA